MITLWYAAIFGLCWGSFLNVVAVRLLESRSLGAPSACPSCHTALAWYELIPVFSWIFLRGRCAHCQYPISLWYPVIECITAFTFIALEMHHTDFLITLVSAAIASCLIVTLRTDGEHQLLLVPVMRCMFVLGVIAALLDPRGIIMGLGMRSVAAAIGFFGITLIAYLYRRFRGRVGMGDGDAELLGSIGMALGPIGLWSAFALGPWLGMLHIAYLWLRGNLTAITPVPFGAYCCAGALIYLIFY